MTNETLAKLKNVVGQAEALSGQLDAVDKAIHDIHNAISLHIDFNPVNVTVQTGTAASVYNKLDP